MRPILRGQARRWAACAALVLLCWSPATLGRAFSLHWYLANPAAFTPAQRGVVEPALAAAAALWERHITGYQPGISLTGLTIAVYGQTTGFASAQISGSVEQGGFRLSTGGRVNVNVTVLEPFANYQGTGLNVIDELMAHEMGHVLGIGPLWGSNGLYVAGSGRYTGRFGLAAYRGEFDPAAEFVPVELAGSSGTPDYHWDQRMRSSSQEGNPADPFSLDPRTGIVDALGRDLGLELMTGAIDPDFGEPFLSRTTVQSLRDLGFTVVSVPEPGTWLLALWTACCAVARRRGATRCCGAPRLGYAAKGRMPA